ncbi:MAG: aminotransferase class V-fold PLP-dependent enzyme [Alphaproteobacteria bacterium]|nr:aminotransferase class V-fold PLP-dependent enzyme [Alphaproteobacteria bacterium]
MLSESEVHELRREAPGIGHVVHFNHSGASLMSRAVLEKIGAQLRREAEIGPHEAHVPVMAQIEKARADAANLLGAGQEDVAFVGSGSTGWGMAFAALPSLGAGDRILVGRQEWGSNLTVMRLAAERAGAIIEAIPCLADGSVDAEALDRMIDARVRLISLTWLPANGGLINDAAAIGKIARRHGVAYFVDAGQALGQIPVDVEEIGCDVLKGAARKFLRGPRGTALLYVRSAMRARMTMPFLNVVAAEWKPDGPVLRKDARIFESGEQPVALLLGLGEALAQARAIGIERIRARIAPLADLLREKLSSIPGITLRDLGAGPKSGLVSFEVAGIPADTVRVRLAAEHGINVGANGVAYTPLDMTARGLAGIVRASVSYLTTIEEIDRLVQAVRQVAAKAA